jgi:hypothetical protein
MAVFPLTKIEWRPSWRIIPSRFPPIDLFERIAPREDWDVLAQIETLTNDRVRLEKGAAALVRLEDRLSGPGTSLIMAPFSHPRPDGDRFSDGTFGIAYAFQTFEAALARSIRSREEFLRRTNEGPAALQVRVLNIDLCGMLHDMRGQAANDYVDLSRSRELSRELRAEGSYGLLFEEMPSVGFAAATFRPTVFSNCRQERHLAYKWDGVRIVEYFDYQTGIRHPIGT